MTDAFTAEGAQVGCLVGLWLLAATVLYLVAVWRWLSPPPPWWMAWVNLTFVLVLLGGSFFLLFQRLDRFEPFRPERNEAALYTFAPFLLVSEAGAIAVILLRRRQKHVLPTTYPPA